MSYFNYHAKIRKLIKQGDCIAASLVYKYHKISPAMIFYFKSNPPMPVRDYRWQEYFPLIKQYSIPVSNLDNIYYEDFLNWPFN